MLTEGRMTEQSYQILPKLTDDELQRLTASIRERGVEVPILLDERGCILDGHHRAMIADSLGMDYPTQVRAGLAEWEKRLLAVTLNVDRRQMTDAQRVMLGQTIEPDIAHKAKARQGTRTDLSGTFPANAGNVGEASDEIAMSVGLGSGDTYERGKKVVTAIQHESPEMFPELKRGTKTLKDARRTLRDKRQQQAIARASYTPKDDTPPKPPYRVILADPPWSYDQKSQRLNGTTDRHYPTMTTDEIAGLPVASVAADDAILLLWTTWPFLTDALGIIDAWGFRYVTGLPWVKADQIGTDIDGEVRFKPNKGVGFWFRGSTEPLLLAKRGTPPRAASPCDGILSDRNIHSRKPTLVHDIAESFGGPCLELFARERRPGWALAGDAIDGGKDICDALAELSR